MCRQLACSGSPQLTFRDFSTRSVTLMSKLAGVTSAPRRDQEEIHRLSCRVPSTLVDRILQTGGSCQELLFNAAKA